jgi:uncharacterized protein YjbI with pentapeptide repeats
MSKNISKNQKISQQISEEAIRKRAYELWKAEGEGSNGQDNWNKAKLLLEQEKTQALKGLRKIAFQINQPLIFLEKRVFEPCADWFERAAFFQIIEKLSPLLEATGVLLIPLAIWWFTESGNEVKERQEKATRGHQAVQSYLNQLSNILLQGGVKELEKNEGLRNITRAVTLALLQNPDLQVDLKEIQYFDEKRNGLIIRKDFNDNRKALVIRYLSETKLIQSLEIEEKQKSPVIRNLSEDKQKSPIIGHISEGLGFSVDGEDFQEALKVKLKPSVISLKGANLSGANLSATDLLGANLEIAILFKADLSLANLERANLKRANLSGVNLFQANLLEANLERANLSDAYLSWTFLPKANLSKANLWRTKLWSTTLWNANLEGAYLSGAYLENVDLSSANLKGANLSGTNLSGANLEAANLEAAKYTNTNTNPKVCKYIRLEAPCATQFPQGFNPITAKMVLIQNIDDIK